MHLDDLLRRPGLAPSTRLLAIGLVTIWHADWERFRAVAAAGRNREVPRAAFEEMLLQAVLFCGFPRVVTAFEQLGRAWPATTAPRGGELPVTERLAAGEALFGAIYGANADQVAAMLRGFHEDFHGFVFEVAYGRVLSRPGLSGRDRELLAVAALVASNQKRQFAGHARGALHLGASREELREVLLSICTDSAEVEAWLARIPPVAEPDRDPDSTP